MSVQINAYPLSWPKGWPRSPQRIKSRFRTALPGALKNVRGSLTLFAKDSKKAVGDIIISSNVTLGEHAPKDGGVAVWFTWDDQQLCIAVDRYEKPEENLQAIHHIIEARRTELEHGGIQMIRQTFKGFQAKALPAADRNSWAILGIPEGSPKSDIEEAYRLKMLELKNNNDVSDENLRRLNVAKQEALEAHG